MSDPMQKSLQGTSQFVNFQATMQKSLCGSSQKIPIQNASSINRSERQRDMKAFKQLKGNKSIKQQQVEQENQFLNVGKWNKQRQSQMRKVLQNDKQKLKLSETSQKQKQKPKQTPPLQQPPTSKWQKKKSNQSSNRSSQPLKNNQPDKANSPNQRTQSNKEQVKQPIQQPQQLIQDDVQNEEQNQENSEQQEQQQDEQDEQDEQQEEQEEDEDEEQEQEQGEQQEEDQQQQQQQEKTKGETNSCSEQSSHAYKTQSVNTSDLNQTTGKPSKWSKKRSPLQTMTKYETKQPNQNQSGKPYHSRLNSATHLQKQQEDQITQDIQPENVEQWQRVQKILLRLKLMLS